jgi:hypothetical protein
MGKQKIESQDTIDTATHFLHRLQADGWALEGLEQEIEYAQARPGGPKLVIGSVVTIKLIPIR